MGRTGSWHMGSAADKSKEKSWNVRDRRLQPCPAHDLGAIPQCKEGCRAAAHFFFAARSWRKEIILPRASSHRAKRTQPML